MSTDTDMAAGLAAFGAVASSWRSCVVEQVSESSDGQGGQSETWSTLYSSVPCLLAPKGTKEETEAGRVRSYVAYRVLIPVLTSAGSYLSVTGKHRLSVAASSPYPAMTLLIDGVPQVSGLYFEIDAKHYN